MALTEIGEVEVSVHGRDWLFRPSFAAMTRLGDPAEIVQMFADLFAEPLPIGHRLLDTQRIREFRRRQFRAALLVLWACSSDDITPLVGGYKPSRSGLRYQQGFMPLRDIVVVAQSLMQHGVIGKVKKGEREKQKEAEYAKEFDAKSYVYTAVSHLGMSEREAWDMTMTGFVSAMRAKYPPEKDAGAAAPSVEQHDHTMSWLQRVNAARGVH